ncbi:MAG: ATP-dependent Clp protease proteolytic subunit [Lachnospiraceae bacterium]|nr:ATP-dependent Clp protease proteolytic subunit [Lachnospiraceae bacterium]
MNVQVKSSNGITLMPAETKLLESNRCIFLEGEINQESALEFVKSLMVLTASDASKPVKVLVNSPGGDVNAGMLIYDAIQSSIVPVQMFCLGRAYSMGALIFLSGRNGRYMLKNSELMLHEPLIGGKIGGNTSSIKEISDSLIKTRDKLNKIISEHSGKTIEEVEKETDHDHYYSAEESVEFGICDEIVEFSKIMEG